MGRLKGWAHRLNKMTAEQRRNEIRRLERVRAYVYDKEAKLQYLANLSYPIDRNYGLLAWPLQSSQ
jgi:hypothetical protein